MSEIGKEMEEEEEVVDHWSHHHPLTLVQTSIERVCHGCHEYVSIGKHMYGCSKKCTFRELLHQECAEMAKKIRHPMHPQHILIQNQNSLGKCAICERHMNQSTGYECTSSDCEFVIHMRCAQDRGVMDADDDAVIHSHPSHPQHPLVRVSRRPCSLRCDACGTTHKGIFYACSACQYWIHHTCATLPDTIQSKDHPHSLTLSFSTLLEYITSHCECDVCQEYLFVPKYWIYHCQPCRYVAHVKCAYVNPIHPTLPINDVVKEQIKPFVKRGQKEHDQILVNVKYKFHHHKHQLSLISSSSEEEKSSHDDEECGEKSELICDGCITPIIYEKKHSSSSSYMSCSECKYFLHMACFQLPLELPSLPLHHKVDHSLILKSFAKLDFWKSCIVCGLYMNGLYYACTNSRCNFIVDRCNFIVDIKCASLLDPVYHFAHPHHLLHHLSLEDMGWTVKDLSMEDMRESRFSFFSLLWNRDNDSYYFLRLCDAGCGETAVKSNCYISGSRDFVVHVKCAALPALVTDRRWDEHPLMLTYAANENDRPDVFYCDKCEGEMNPRSWTYNCRHCDSSFHPDCFSTISGKYRNIKFGQQYVVATAHPHPLTCHVLTLKRRCDVCHLDKVGERGFQCASCYFFVCLDQCGKKMLEQGHIQTAD